MTPKEKTFIPTLQKEHVREWAREESRATRVDGNPAKSGRPRGGQRRGGARGDGHSFRAMCQRSY